MLKLMLGRAGSGKTSAAMQEVKRLAENNGQKSLFIVPEQFSHDAERHLSQTCGDSINLYAEVLSFSRLCSRVFAEVGGVNDKVLDAGGRILLMHRALICAAPALKVYVMADRKTEFLESLLFAYDEFKTANINTSDLYAAAETMSPQFKDKIRDLISVFETYDAIKPDNVFDPRERLSKLADGIKNSKLFKDEHIFVDGFGDFTEQEILVLEELLKKGVDMTICLTCDGLYSGDDIFELPRRTANRFMRFARERGIETAVETRENDAKNRAPELLFMEKHLFSYDDEKYLSPCTAVELYRADNITGECELAAAKILELIREYGCRWRDISVVVRGWDKYGTVIENVFSKYGVPAIYARKKDILQQPLMLCVTSALDVVSGGWQGTDIFKFLKTNLTGISFYERDMLEDYVLKWNIRGEKMWSREEPWEFNPAGEFRELSEHEAERLRRINEVRLKVAAPLKKLMDNLHAKPKALDKVTALYEFLCDMEIPARIEEKAAYLGKIGRIQTRDEYARLWDVLVSAMEQFAAISGEEELSDAEFINLFKLLISRYDIGTIPATVDAVGVGEMARMRRRDIKYMLVLGAADGALPAIGANGGLLSEHEREELQAAGFTLGNSGEEEINREMNVIYSSFTLPSDKLIVSYCGGEDSARPSFVVSRLADMFGVEEREVGNECKISAEIPCFELAAEAENLPGDKNAAMAAAYFANDAKRAKQLSEIRDMATASRGRLSKESARRLYGDKLNLTASRVDKYQSCKFAYFMQYGLRAKLRKTAGFDAPTAGTFMHFVLENVAKEAGERGGFGALAERELDELTRKYTNVYIETVLGNFRDKSSRFKYLFNRLQKDVYEIVRNMAQELKNSNFEPVDFELDFSHSGDLPPVTISEGDTEVSVNGKVDRVDGWLCGDKLYLKIVDYKTGKKAFNLSDIWYGLGMQMLIYLFALEREGKARYNATIVPAGVLYAPARDIILSSDKRISDDEIAAKRAKNLVRSGLLLDNADVIEAMENGPEHKYLPVKFTKDSAPTGESLATVEQLGKLSRHIDKTLLEMGKQIKNGAVSANPYYKNSLDNACIYCDYYEACHFDEAGGEDSYRYLTKLKTPEVWKRMEKEGDERESE